jgi:hypothetical protein
MSILASIKNALFPKSYPATEFGMSDFEFFVALLRACPERSRLSFDQSEPESFVHAFREWSHRADPSTFEADYYSIDARFVAAVEQSVARGELMLDHHFGIVAPDGRPLCGSLDDFTVVTLSDDIRNKLLTNVA